MPKIVCGADGCESVHCQVVGYIDHEAGRASAPRTEVLCGGCLYERNLSPTAYGIEKLTRAYVEECNESFRRPLHCDCCGNDLIEED